MIVSQAGLLSVSPEGVRQRLALELRDEVSDPISHGPAGFALMLDRRQGRKLHRVGSVIVTQSDLSDAPGEEWLHASIARIDRMPSYADLAALHKAVFGARYAYQVFAPPAAHVNIHATTLHLWGRVDDGDGRLLPDFGAGGTI